MLMTTTQYAARRGVSEAAVRRAIKDGRISAQGGKIDPETADREWVERTVPTRGGYRPKGKPVVHDGMKPVPGEAIATVEKVIGSGNLSVSGEVTYMEAKLANEILRAQTAEVKLAKVKGELVDRAKATALVFDLARRERDAWLSWPARVAPNMAAELGIDPHELETVLVRHLHDHLGEMAEVGVEFR